MSFRGGKEGGGVYRPRGVFEGVLCHVATVGKGFVKTPFAKPHLCYSILIDPFAKPHLCHNMAKVMAKVMALP